ncbi:hypothetical protein [Paenibacillus sp. NPDC058174]|uniref:hypothetical protein n=1 Tax=Paenibacillus sp. NPDC058174 TaxID=3346366 RepID=UPI0036DC97B0
MDMRRSSFTRVLHPLQLALRRPNIEVIIPFICCGSGRKIPLSVHAIMATKKELRLTRDCIHFPAHLGIDGSLLDNCSISSAWKKALGSAPQPVSALSEL